MGSKKKLIVAIPVYKSEMTDSELFSLQTVCRILSNRIIALVYPDGLNIDVYTTIMDENGIQYEVKPFNKSYFSSIGSYNKLMLSEQFYQTFSNHDYLLIYQLDCLIFRDDLDFWMAKNYDYMGAPWFNNKPIENVIFAIHKKETFTLNIRKTIISFLGQNQQSIGNGGFSLRKIETMVKCAKKWHQTINSWGINEDCFWGIFLPLYQYPYSVPDIETALRFSVEALPENSDVLTPTGCHAWEKFNLPIEKWINADTDVIITCEN